VICALLLQAAEALSAAPVQAVDREEVAGIVDPVATHDGASGSPVTKQRREIALMKADAILYLFRGREDGLLRHTCGDEGPIALAATEDQSSAAWTLDHRLGWTTNSLDQLAAELRRDARRARQRFLGDSETARLYREPSNYYAAALERAADILAVASERAALAKAHPPASEKTEGGEG
jgi:hypothetical protein